MTIYVDSKNPKVPPEWAIELITDEWIATGNCCYQTIIDLRDELKKQLSKTAPFGKSVLIEVIYAEIQQVGSQKALAQEWGISEQYLSDVFRGNREPGPKILEALGLRKIVTYDGW